MKYNSLSLISVVCLAVSLSSCYQDIDLDKYKEQNGRDLLTINSIINPDSTISVAATKTYFFSDEHSERSYVKDLSIQIYINGENKGTLSFNPSTQLYTGNVIPSELDEVSLKVQYGDSLVNCSDIVPAKVSIDSISVSMQGPTSIYTDNDYVFTYNISFTDPTGCDNYYFLNYDNVFLSGSLNMGERVFSSEYVFQQLARQINAHIPGWEPYSPQGLPFTDFGIEGKKHTLIVKEIVQAQGSGMSHYKKMLRKIKLYSISKNYYNYLLSMIYNDPTLDGLHGGLIDLGVTEPIKYFTNISGGLGIFAAYSLDQRTIDVYSMLGFSPQ